MKKMIKKAAVTGTVMSLMASMVLGGCGKQDADEPVTQLDPNGKSYVADFYDVKGLNGSNASVTNMVSHEDKLFAECYDRMGEHAFLKCLNKADMSEVATIDFNSDFEANVNASEGIEADISKLTTSINILGFDFQEDRIRLFADWYAYDESGYDNLPADPDESDIEEVESYDKLYVMDYNLNYEFINAEEINTDFATDNDTYLSDVNVGNDGNYYVLGNHEVYVLDQSYNPVQTIKVSENWCENLFSTSSGEMYVSYYSENWITEVAKINAASNTVGEKLDISESSMGGFCASATEDNIIYYVGYDALIKYDIATKESVALFRWMDMDIQGESVGDIVACEDGSFLIICNDWTSYTSQIANIHQVSNSDIVAKTEIKIASLYGYDSILDSAIVAFNKSQDKYHIVKESYFNWENDGDSKADAIANLNNALTGSSAPDIVCLEGLDVRELVKKGMFEDLNGYLANSSEIKVSDYNETVVDAFTYDGKLISLPRSFNIMTVVVGADKFPADKEGWTMDEMLDYANANPGAMLEAYMVRNDMMQNYIGTNLEEYIDWNTGEVNFNVPSFRKALEYAATLPEDYDWSNLDPNFNFSEALSQGQILSQRMYLSECSDIQMINAYFKEGAVFIGFPNAEGKNRQVLTTDTGYSILSTSANKDGAWEFLQFYLTRERSEWDYSFPSNVHELQAMFDKELEHAGEKNGSMMMDDTGWEYEYHYSTQEEIDQIMEIINNAVAVDVDTEIINIINEEAGGFFSGQKGLDEVIGLIQSRVQLYVSERM